MSEFEFIAVFVSIIFGLSLTQILSGAVAQTQKRALGSDQLGWTLFCMYVLAINWWTFFPWSENEVWTFGEFFVVLIWALSHYFMASALYPSRSLEDYSFAERRPLVLWGFLFAASTDMAQTAVQGAFFEPWYYSVFVLFMMGTSAIGLLTSNEQVHRLTPWFLIMCMVAWSGIVRWVLG
ncbi:MAG: hypothetical protein V2I57_05110 [Xanthomonadales bacterium]|jgi:hypothetical protein|nr:hypothetical protein [Xanthomonadales bacterium]